MDYERQAKDFLKKAGVECAIRFAGKVTKRWLGDNGTYEVNKYLVTFERPYAVQQGRERKITFTFYDSVHNTESGECPTPYDVLSCLQKYPLGTFEEFCDDYGYEKWGFDGYNKESYALYEACVDEYAKVAEIFGDYLDELREVQ